MGFSVCKERRVDPFKQFETTTRDPLMTKSAREEFFDGYARLILDKKVLPDQ